MIIPKSFYTPYLWKVFFSQIGLFFFQSHFCSIAVFEKQGCKICTSTACYCVLSLPTFCHKISVLYAQAHLQHT